MRRADDEAVCIDGIFLPEKAQPCLHIQVHPFTDAALYPVHGRNGDLVKIKIAQRRHNPGIGARKNEACRRHKAQVIGREVVSIAACSHAAAEVVIIAGANIQPDRAIPAVRLYAAWRQGEVVLRGHAAVDGKGGTQFLLNADIQHTKSFLPIQLPKSIEQIRLDHGLLRHLEQKQVRNGLFNCVFERRYCIFLRSEHQTSK